MTAGFVRAGRSADAPELARIQVASWRASLASLVPDAVLAQLTSAEAEQRWAERWLEAVTSPPTSRHRVHIAVEPGAGFGEAGETGEPGERAGTPGTSSMRPVGFASAGPATDADMWPGTDGELYELHVLPAAAGQGHGARLLHAVADTLAEDGFRTACTWALSADEPRLEFLEAAGWAPDGAHSNLDMGVKVHVIRLHTRLSPGAG